MKQTDLQIITVGVELTLLLFSPDDPDLHVSLHPARTMLIKTKQNKTNFIKIILNYYLFKFVIVFSQ